MLLSLTAIKCNQESLHRVSCIIVMFQIIKTVKLKFLVFLTGNGSQSEDDDGVDDDGEPRTPYSVEQVEATIMRTIQVLEECEDE